MTSFSDITPFPIRFRFLILALGLPLLLPAEGTAQTAREKLISLAKNYTSDGAEILQRAGDFKFEQYLDREDTAGLLEGFGTVVHESCHQINHMTIVNSGKSNRRYQNYFINKGVDIAVEQGPVFNST